MNLITPKQDLRADRSEAEAVVNGSEHCLPGKSSALAGRIQYCKALAALAVALTLAACTEAPPPRQFSTLDDYLTHPDPCVANTAKSIKASGRPWPNEEYPDPQEKGRIKIFDLWAGDHLYRIDTRRLNIFQYGERKGEKNHPLQYGVLNQSLIGLASGEWVEEHGLPRDVGVYGVRYCRAFEKAEDEIRWLHTFHPEGKPVERSVFSAESPKKPIAVREWHIKAHEDGKSVANSYIYGFLPRITQDVYGKQVEVFAQCSGRLGERYKTNRQMPSCEMSIWLGPGVKLVVQMTPPAPEYIGEVFILIKNRLDESRIK